MSLDIQETSEIIGQAGQKNVEANIFRDGPIVTIKKGDATFTIAYGGHHTRDRFITKLNHKFNGYFPEKSSDSQYLVDGTNALAELIPEEITALQERKIPAYLTDINQQGLLRSISVVGVESILLAAETMIGKELLQKSAQLIKQPRHSRRRFMAGMAGVAAGAFMTVPMISMLGRAASGLTGVAEHESAELMKFNNKVHPEVFLIGWNIRNVLIAHKELAIADQTERPNFLTVAGSLHPGIEDQLLYTAEERLDFLEKSKPIWRHTISPEYMYKAAKVVHDGSNWNVEIIEFPDLKELVK